MASPFGWFRHNRVVLFPCYKNTIVRLSLSPIPRDYPAIDKLQTRKLPVAVKYSGLAELEGFILPHFRMVLLTDREFFGQHTLATPSYIRKRRRAASKQIDPNKLRPGDYVVHRSHGIGKFLKLESLT